MSSVSKPVISIVIPVFNESAGIAHLHKNLLATIAHIPDYNFEIIYCDDGSRDDSRNIISQFDDIKLLVLSKNFGKEYALTALIKQASGDAIISLDADGQHPVELIPQFIKAWEAGSQVVIGVRSHSGKQSKLFYSLFNKFSGEALVDGGTDFRLIDRSVQEAFLQLEEGGRITRGLIDWLGFERTFIPFDVQGRTHGKPTYSTKKLVQLAINGFVSLSNIPLYIFGVTGIIITALSGLLGISVIIEQFILGDPWNWNFTGTAMLGILIIFLVGIVLMSQGILALYISAIHRENKRRPLYVINHGRSVNITSKKK